MVTLMFSAKSSSIRIKIGFSEDAVTYPLLSYLSLSVNMQIINNLHSKVQFMSSKSAVYQAFKYIKALNFQYTGA
jgi:hypothetical protein